jgi:hypothetical protein
LQTLHSVEEVQVTQFLTSSGHVLHPLPIKNVAYLQVSHFVNEEQVSQFVIWLEQATHFYLDSTK